MNTVYELVDATNDESYFTLGMYSSLEKALEYACQDVEPDEHPLHSESTEPGWDYQVTLEIREHKLDQLPLDGRHQTVRTIEWVGECDAETDEHIWRIASGDEGVVDAPPAKSEQ